MRTIREEITNLEVYIVLKDNHLKAIIHIKSFSHEGRAVVDVWEEVGKKLISHGSERHDEHGLKSMAGAIIDNIKLFGPNGHDEKSDKLAARMRGIHAGHPQYEVTLNQAKKIGAQFVNWDKGANTWQDCYYLPGLERLKALGYDVIQVF